MTPTIDPKDASLGATITDIDLANLDDATWKVVEDAFLEYGVLIFPGQHLSDDEQIAFASRFGDLEHVLASIANQKPDGSIMRDDEHRYWILRGNERWHIDSSFMPLAAKASCLTAMVVPDAGGETEWADMRAGYQALDEVTKTRVESLSALHSNYYSHERLGQHAETGDGYGFHVHGAPMRSLVKVHPVTGRKSLYVGRHAYGIPGMTEAQSAAFLTELVEFAARPPRTTGHRWRAGDIAIWDNRCVLHRVQPYDYSQARVMRHTRVAGDRASELAETVPDARANAFEPAGA